jgi:eukaryotic-like serine/threonine-protein kinase
MRRLCRHCNEATEVNLPPTGGIFRCAHCFKLNLLLPQSPRGLLEFLHYQVQEEVGQGANAVVCRSISQQNQGTYALKLFLSAEHAEEHSMREFLRESSLAMEIVHRNIVRVHEGGENNGIPYLLMEFVDGINMSQYLDNYGKMEGREALSMACFVCSALDYVWSDFMMIHRDIKPQNIMLDNQGQVKVCDFGMITRHEQAMVDLNAVEGTPYYLSPECITEGAYQDNRSDLYSLGATLYHLIAGLPPFNYDNVTEVVDARLKEDVPDIRLVAPEVSEDVAMVLKTMMAKNPDDRYVTARECLEDLQRVRKGQKPVLVDPRRRRTNQ